MHLAEYLQFERDKEKTRNYGVQIDESDNILENTWEKWCCSCQRPITYYYSRYDVYYIAFPIFDE